MTMKKKGTRSPWFYFLIHSASLSPPAVTWLTISFRLLFKFALEILYGSIVAENADACY